MENDREMTLKVNLGRHECNCGVWQVGGVPCVHAMNVMMDRRMDEYIYVDPCHLVSKFVATYAGHICPITNPLTWLDFEDIYKVNPPRVVRPDGRTRTQRRKDRDEDDGIQQTKRDVESVGSMDTIRLVTKELLMVIHPL